MMLLVSFCKIKFHEIHRTTRRANQAALLRVLWDSSNSDPVFSADSSSPPATGSGGAGSGGGNNGGGNGGDGGNGANGGSGGDDNAGKSPFTFDPNDVKDPTQGTTAGTLDNRLPDRNFYDQSQSVPQDVDPTPEPKTTLGKFIEGLRAFLDILGPWKPD
jgi:hypothetical protein